MRDISDADTCPRCQKCDRWRNAPDYIRDPWVLWDRFPCPPPDTPNKARLLLELDWTGQLGSRDGCKALRRVASRCKVDLTTVELSAESLSECDQLFTVFGLCGTQCLIAIILACICLMFVFLLVIVCCRYVGTDKSAGSPYTKPVSHDQTTINTQENRYYVQSQYYYRASNIPERRGLPFVARTTENGVESRLIKAIQQAPLQGYQFDDMCTQCQKSISRQSTLSGRSRQGYERIYWRDKEGLEKRVPSHESLTHRRASDRHRSIAGSSSDMSHYYEYISDNPYDGSTGRRSNHSTLYFPRNSSSNFKDISNYGDSRCSEDERVLMLSRLINTEMELRNGTPTHREVVPYKPNTFAKDCGTEDQIHYHGSLQDQNMYNASLTDQNHYSGSLNGQACYTDNAMRPEVNIIQHMEEDRRKAKCSTAKILDGPVFEEEMKGYKYTYNPSYDEDTTTASRDTTTASRDTTTASRTENGELSSSVCTPSDCLECEEIPYNRDYCDSSSSSHFKKTISKSHTPSLRSNRNSESTSLSDNSLSNSFNIPKTNGSLYKTNRSK